MQRSEARAVLHLAADSDDPAELRAAYRRRLREVHPDRNPGAGSTEATIAITTAYRVLSSPAPTTPATERAPRPRRRPPDAAPTRPPGLSVEVLDADTLAVAAPRDETLLAVIEAAHRLGEVIYLDPGAGLVEAVVEFVEAPTSSVLMSLQGRATGTTEVFCTVEPLSGGTAPPHDAVTRLVAHTLRAIEPDEVA